MGLDKSVPIDYLHLTLVDGSSVTAMHVRLCVCVRGWVCMCVCVCEIRQSLVSDRS